MTVVSKHVGAV